MKIINNKKIHLGPIENWKLAGIPLLIMTDLNEKSQLGETHCCILSTNVQLKSPVFLDFKKKRKLWTYEDHYCNPGPIQYYGFSKNFTTITLILQHKLFNELQNNIEEYCNKIKSSCRLGSDESVLKAAAYQLKTITKILGILENKL